uniref:RNase H domain-containing protein n=1 Tax=Trichuris muris TaxID=70415 RepID=A0A5S6QCD8_TRIMR
MWVKVNGLYRRALVDSGCTKCIVHTSCCDSWRERRINVTTISGELLRCIGTASVRLQPSEESQATVQAIVTDRKPLDFDLIIGMGGITALGGVSIGRQGEVRFGPPGAAACAGAEAQNRIEEKDFTVTYNPATRSWTVVWKWTNGLAPEVLPNAIHEYPPAPNVRTEYEEELNLWVQNGWLIPYDEGKLGPPKALIPLMAITQRSKGKVRPVMDFRELNAHIDTFTANCDVCAHRLREWRRQGANVAIIDLNKAYLQLHVDQSFWPYQSVIFNGRRYCLTRLGFGLNVAPAIMKAVINHVLSLSADVQRGTSAYLDDILVNEDIIDANRVKQHLASYGLACKDPERVSDGTRMLGLYVRKRNGAATWSRGSKLPSIPQRLTRRTIFSYCGELVGHYPVCGWLRPMTAFIKREVNDATSTWDEPIRHAQVREHLHEIGVALKAQDPARGRWDVHGDEARVWVDASSLAIGVALEVDGTVIEDGTWLRPDDARHINMAELDAIIKGLNLAIAWQMKRIEIMTDSATVHRWIDDGLSGRTRLRTKAANEMLIRRRVATVLALTEEYSLDLAITLVKSMNNRADALTRVPRRWLASTNQLEVSTCAVGVSSSLYQSIVEVHRTAGHPGIRRTLYFAKRRDPTVSKKPSTGKMENRKPGSEKRLAKDCDRRHPCQRCAYAPSGNGIIQRCHRTIKVIAARKGCTVNEAVYLYNVMPRDNRSASTAPANAVYRYAIRVRGIDLANDDVRVPDCRYATGDHVWIKPPATRCDTQFDRGTITKILSDQAVEVDGVPRHVRDVRKQASSDEVQGNPSGEDNGNELVVYFPAQPVDDEAESVPAPPAAQLQELRRSSRVRRPPRYLCCD